VEHPRPRFVVPVQGGRPSPRAEDASALAAAASSPPPPAAAGGDERFRALFEHAPVGVALAEPGGRFTDVNRTLRELLAGTGIDPDVDGLADLARHVPEGSDEAQAWRTGLEDVCAGRAPVARAELPLAAPGEAPRWVQATAALVVLGDHRYVLAHVEDATGRRLAEERLLQLALHDGLTGLANRTLLEERLAAALAGDERTGLHTGVLYVDLDGFKRVNDAFGHEVGDQVLVAVGRRLAAALRAGDTAGRVGGDEFLVIAGGVPDGAALGELSRRVGAALAAPLRLAGHHRPAVSASVGATLARPGDTLTTVMRRADAAMFTVKRSRRAGARVDVDALQLTLLPDLVAGEAPGTPEAPDREATASADRPA
jgi:diguanylate cyclase (GGDEF)-like protein